MCTSLASMLQCQWQLLALAQHQPWMCAVQVLHMLVKAAEDLNRTQAEIEYRKAIKKKAQVGQPDLTSELMFVLSRVRGVEPALTDTFLATSSTTAPGALPPYPPNNA